MLRSLFPDEESALELTMVSTISILFPTIQFVRPKVLFLDLSASPYSSTALGKLVRQVLDIHTQNLNANK